MREYQLRYLAVIHTFGRNGCTPSEFVRAINPTIRLSEVKKSTWKMLKERLIKMEACGLVKLEYWYDGQMNRRYNVVDMEYIISERKTTEWDGVFR